MHKIFLGTLFSLLVTNVLSAGNPETITTVPPNYTPMARLVRASGVVDIDASLNKDGSVKEILTKPGADRSAPNLLFYPSAEAVMKWKFKPGTLSPVRISFYFHLYPVGTPKETLKTELISSTIMIIKATIGVAETDPVRNP